jgi:type III pantothenate kinase|nr:type III pantothenate kinase [Candidatus Krumholzibacteria bacterium]
MKGLILDVGNTRTKLLHWDGRLHRGTEATDAGLGAPLDFLEAWATPGEPADWAEITTRIAAIRHSYPGCPLAMTTVVPEAECQLTPIIPDLVTVGHRSALPFQVSVADRTAVGSDRYCNLAASWSLGLRTVLVVDIGSATTFDLLLDGVFPGGLIAPGPELALKGLARQTAQLPEIAFLPAPLEAGPDTVSAMTRGAWHVGFGGIQACITGLLDRYGAMPVLVTGGLGHHLEGDLWLHDPHLTLRGAAILAGF